MTHAVTRHVLNTIFILSMVCAASQAHMGATHEPPDGQVLHGLGQYVPVYYTDAENWQLVTEYQNAANCTPFMYSAYQAIEPGAAALDPTDLTDIVTNHSHPYGLLVGIYLLDVNQEPIDVDVLLSGAWDDRITSLATEIASLGVPCFVRPGFEFGASGGIHSDITGPDFIAIWHHIRSVFATVGDDNVAWVWNTVNPSSFDYMSYYPGDEAVDWWGINYFTVGQMNDSDGFVLDAATHNKPVIICESCPIHSGGTTNPATWENWFVPYFSKIAEHAHIKAFSYISDPWDRPGFWESWDDSRIDSDASIAANYAAEMSKPCYVHLTEPIPGDLNGDGSVDQADLGMLLASYNIDAGGDCDGDGDTDQADLGILLAHYGDGC